MDFNMLEEVKKRLGITGEYQDDTIQGYIDDVKQFLLDGGVKKEVVDASSTVGYSFLLTPFILDIDFGINNTSGIGFFISSL